VSESGLSLQQHITFCICLCKQVLHNNVINTSTLQPLTRSAVAVAVVVVVVAAAPTAAATTVVVGWYACACSFTCRNVLPLASFAQLMTLTQLWQACVLPTIVHHITRPMGA
jgi:hypothetical protein